jgi:hypothetical protein
VRSTRGGVLTGKLVEQLGKKRQKTFNLHAVHATVRSGVQITLTVKLPKAALNGLRDKRKESVTFRLTASNAHGTSTKTAKIGRLLKG